MGWEWLIPVIASVAGSATSAGLGSLMAPDQPKPKQPGQGLDSIAQANQGLGQQQQGLMSDDIIMQYLSQAAGRKAG